MVFHDFLGALLVFASLMQSFEELYLNLSLFLLSPKKKVRIIIMLSKQRFCYGHIWYLECLCMCANICTWEAVLCVSSEHFILDFSLQGFPKKTESQVHMTCPWLQTRGNPLGLSSFVAVQSISHFQVTLKSSLGKWRGFPGKGLGAGSCCAVCKEASEGFFFLLVHLTNLEIGSFSAVMGHWETVVDGKGQKCCQTSAGTSIPFPVWQMQS